MTDQEAYSEIRDLLGGVKDDACPNRMLRPHLLASLSWLSKELKLAVVQDSLMFTAEAGRQNYPLPSEVDQVRTVVYNGVPLEAKTTDQWLLDGYYHVGQTAGIPVEYAVEGRSLIFSVPFSADAVTTTTEIRVWFTRSLRDVRSGTHLPIPDSYSYLVTADAAMRYCAANMQNKELAARIPGFQALVARELSTARWEAAQAVDGQQVEFRVNTGRYPAAR